MEEIKKYINENPNLKSEKIPFLKLKGTGKHFVKLLNCEEAINQEYKTKRDIEGFNLFFEEDGEKKKYFIPKLNKKEKIHYLVERFADIEEGTELILEYKKKEGSYEGYIDVRRVDEEDDIPVVDEDVPDEFGG